MYKEITPSGTIKFKEDYRDPLTGKRKTVSITLEKDTPKSRNLAREILDQKIEKGLGLGGRNENMTLEELIELYRVDQKRTVAESTYWCNYYQCETFKKLLNGSVRLSALNAGYVRKCMADCSPTTYNEHLKRFKALIRWGYKNDYIPDIRWLDKLETIPDREKRERLKDKYLEPEEIDTLLQAFQNDLYRRITLFLLLSGLRVGEALALTVEDIKTDCVSVTKSMDSITNQVTPPKTDCSNREVYIQEELRDVIDEQLDYKNQMLMGRSSPYLFCSDSGNPVKYFTYLKYLKNTSKQALGREITSHVMRHTHVSLLAAQGVPLETIMRRVGHVNSRVTEEVYMHVTKAQIVKDNQFIDNVILSEKKGGKKGGNFSKKAEKADKKAEKIS